MQFISSVKYTRIFSVFSLLSGLEFGFLRETAKNSTGVFGDSRFANLAEIC